MKKISIVFVVFVVAIISCKKTPNVNQQQVIIESEVVTVDSTSVSIECKYNYPTILKKAYLLYGEDVDEITMDTMEMQVVQDTLKAVLTGLNDSTTYNYYYEFFNGFNSIRTDLKSFQTN